MTARRPYGDGNTLFGIAAAIVGSAAASRVIPTKEAPSMELENPGPLSRKEEAIIGPAAADDRSNGRTVQVPREIANAAENVLIRLIDRSGITGPGDFDGSWVETTYAARVGLSRAIEEGDRRARLEAEWEQVDPDGVANLRASAAALDVHQALNTYEVAADVPQTFEDVTPSMGLVIGANHRKLIVRWDVDGLWIGGCLITEREVAERLAAFITREADDA